MYLRSTTRAPADATSPRVTPALALALLLTAALGVTTMLDSANVLRPAMVVYLVLTVSAGHAWRYVAGERRRERERTVTTERLINAMVKYIRN